MLDNSKSIRQEKGILLWKDNDFHGTLNYVPRFGKTRVIEQVVSRTRSNNLHSSIMILVPTDIAYQNVRHIEKQYNCICYTKYKLYNAIENGSFNLLDETYILIVDEIHKFLEDKDLLILSKLKAKFKLGLTGSKLNTVEKSNLRKIGFPVIDIITEDEALVHNWIADYEEYNLKVDISESDKRRLKSLTDNIDNIVTNFRGIYKRVNSAFNYTIFNSDFELLQSCYSGKNVLDTFGKFLQFIQPDKLRLVVASIQGYKRDVVITNSAIENIQRFWHPDNIAELAKSYIKAVKARNDYFKYNVSKVNTILELSNKIQKPTIVYNDSIDMIEHLSKSLKVSNVKYHSQMESIYLYDENDEIIRYASGEKKGEPKLFGKTTIKKLAIESITSGESLYLITGRSLNESLNLPMIECIICTSGDTNPNTYDQRVARGKTIDMNNKDKKCLIINIFIDDFIVDGCFVRSRDKEKLILRQSNVKNVIFIENNEDLFATIKNIL